MKESSTSNGFSEREREGEMERWRAHKRPVGGAAALPLATLAPSNTALKSLLLCTLKMQLHEPIIEPVILH